MQVPGLLVTDHFIRVPLDHTGRRPGDITLFVRELVAPANARRPQPHLLYLQGAAAAQMQAVQMRPNLVPGGCPRRMLCAWQPLL